MQLECQYLPLNKSYHNRKTVMIIIVWTVAVLYGLSLMAWYSNKAGKIGSAPQQLPDGTPVTIDNHHYQLLMFIHPRCPCTQSSVRELERLMSRGTEKISCTIFCFQPSDKNKGWSNTDITQSVKLIPNSNLIPDIDGEWIKIFKANTSGHVLLYHPNGQLLFSGGITAARGHEGDNSGKTFISDVVNAESYQNRKNYQCPVFGCPILR